MPDFDKKQQVKLYTKERLLPMLGGETEIVQALGHTMLLYAPHPTSPRLAAELGLGARDIPEER